MRFFRTCLFAMVCAVLAAGCSSDNDPTKNLKGIEKELCTGYWSKSGDVCLRFYSDKTFKYTENEYGFFWDSGTWRVEDENIFFTYDDDKYYKNAPDMMINISIVDGSIYYTKKSGDGDRMQNMELPSFIKDKLIGHTYHTEFEWRDGNNQRHISTHTMTFMDKDIVQWEMADTFRSSGKLNKRWNLTLLMGMNMTEDKFGLVYDENEAYNKMKEYEHVFMLPPTYFVKNEMGKTTDGKDCLKARIIFNYQSYRDSEISSEWVMVK